MLFDLIVCLFGSHVFSWDMVFPRMGGGGMSPSTSYSLYPCCISFLASLPLPPQSLHCRLSSSLESCSSLPIGNRSNCPRWDLSRVQLGFCPTHPFKPAKKNKPLDDWMHWLSMSTWPRRCHGARWRAHLTQLLPYPTSKWAALVLSQMRPSGKVASPCDVDLSSPDGSSVNDRINPDEFTLH